MPGDTKKRFQVHPGFRFYVKIERSGFDQAVFTEASGLNVEATVDQVEEGGQNDFVHQLPSRCKVGNLILKRGMTAGGEFIKWMLDVAVGKVEPVSATVTIYQADGSIAATWDLIGVFPIKWSGVQFRSTDNTVAIETLELAHSGLRPVKNG